MDSESEAIFNLKLQIEQLQEKVQFLAGGTDGEQLAELLMEKEEEGRVKDRHIARLEQQAHDLSDQLAHMEKDRNAFQALSIEQASTIEALELRSTNLDLDKDRLTAELKTAYGQIDGLEAERRGLEQLLEATKGKLESTASLLSKRESELVRLQESLRANERMVEDLSQRKKDMASRTRTMKLEYEQKLAEEKTNYGILEGQLTACKKEIDELNRQLFEKTRIVEEYQVKENSLAQEKGRLEIKVTTLGEENRKLQHNILQLEKQRKDTESQNVCVNSKAAKYEEDIVCLQRELERQKVAKENDLSKISQQARLRDQQWKDKLKREREEFMEMVREREEQLAMCQEEHETREGLLCTEVHMRDEHIAALRDEVQMLMGRVDELDHQNREMDAYQRGELEAERKWRINVQAEMTELRKELQQQRKAANEYARIRQENDTLKEKIARQEAYMRRKMMKEKGKVGDSFLSSAFADTKPLGDEDPNKGSYADFHTTSTAASNIQQTVAHSPPSYKSRMFLREDKENHVYKGSMGAAPSGGLDKGMSSDTLRGIRASTPPLRRELAPAGRASTPLSARAPAQPKSLFSSGSKASVSSVSGVVSNAPRTKTAPSAMYTKPSPARATSPSPRTWR